MYSPHDEQDGVVCARLRHGRPETMGLHVSKMIGPSREVCYRRLNRYTGRQRKGDGRGEGDRRGGDRTFGLEGLRQLSLGTADGKRVYRPGKRSLNDFIFGGWGYRSASGVKHSRVHPPPRGAALSSIVVLAAPLLPANEGDELQRGRVTSGGNILRLAHHPCFVRG